MSEKRLCMASGDGHAGAPTDVYRDYLEPRLRRVFDDYYASGHPWRWSPSSENSFLFPAFHEKFVGTEGFDPDKGQALAWDPDLRLKTMDQCGLACEILNSDDQNRNDPPFGASLGWPVEGAKGSAGFPPELTRAGARAYNRWLADFCATDPRRLLGVINLGTLDDVVWCVEEIQRAYDSGLQTAVLLPLEYDLPAYHHPRYDLLWRTCTELGLSVEVHIGAGHPAYLGEDPFAVRFMYMFEAYWYAQRPFWCLMIGGVLERNPELRLVFTEMGIEWVAPMLSKLDHNGLAHRPMNVSRDVPGPVDLPLTAFEYWQRQCYVTHSIHQRRDELEGDAYKSVPNMVWGTDLGHGEGIWPSSVEQSIKQLLVGLPASTGLSYLQDNFFRAYPNVDRAALDDVVERIGVPISELGLIG